MFERINKWYNVLKIWTKDMVKDAVVKKVITEEQYKEITGEEYTDLLS